MIAKEEVEEGGLPSEVHHVKKESELAEDHTIKQNILGALDGIELVGLLLEGAPKGNRAFGQGNLYKRALIFLEEKQLIENNFGHSWTKLDKEKKIAVKTQLGEIKLESPNLKLLKTALLVAPSKEEPVIDLTSSEESLVKHAQSGANQIALMAHVIVDPQCQDLLKEYFQPLPIDGKITAFAAGIKETVRLKLKQVVDYANDNRNRYHNMFAGDWKVVANIHPSDAMFTDTSSFHTLYTRCKNEFDKVMNWLTSKTGENEAGIDRDQKALRFLSEDIPMFYTYLLWKDQNTTFTSNALPIGIGIRSGVDLTEREGSSSSSSSNPAIGRTLPATGSKPPRGTTNKMLSALKDTMQNVIAPLLKDPTVIGPDTKASSSSNPEATRTAMQLAESKIKERSVSIQLKKRQLEDIEQRSKADSKQQRFANAKAIFDDERLFNALSNEEQSKIMSTIMSTVQNKEDV